MCQIKILLRYEHAVFWMDIAGAGLATRPGTGAWEHKGTCRFRGRSAPRIIPRNIPETYPKHTQNSARPPQCPSATIFIVRLSKYLCSSWMWSYGFRATGSVLQSTSLYYQVRVCTPKYEFVLQGTSLCYRVWVCTTEYKLVLQRTRFTCLYYRLPVCTTEYEVAVKGASLCHRIRVCIGGYSFVPQSTSLCCILRVCVTWYEFVSQRPKCDKVRESLKLLRATIHKRSLVYILAS